MPHAGATAHDEIHDLLTSVRTVAVIGCSADPARASHQIAMYLRRAGFDVIPVNPLVDPHGGDVGGLKCYARLADVPGPVDLVVVFRRSEEAMVHVEEAIAHKARGVWLQQGVTTPHGAARAREGGLIYVENRCVMVEHRQRLRLSSA